MGEKQMLEGGGLNPQEYPNHEQVWYFRHARGRSVVSRVRWKRNFSQLNVSRRRGYQRRHATLTANSGETLFPWAQRMQPD